MSLTPYNGPLSSFIGDMVFLAECQLHCTASGCPSKVKCLLFIQLWPVQTTSWGRGALKGDAMRPLGTVFIDMRAAHKRRMMNGFPCLKGLPTSAACFNN